MKLTKNFELKEFLYSRFFNKYQEKVLEQFEADKDILLPNVQKLANQLQVLRDYLGKPIHINIAYRPYWWEIMQGRTGASQHQFCKAADIKVDGLTPKEVAEAIEHLISNGDMLQGGIGSSYKSFTHYDIRRTKARW